MDESSEKERKWNEKRVVTMCTGDDGERKNEMEVRKKKRLLRMQRISGARKKERTKLKK